ncbi:hypothetical protein MRB53_030103 [Persea americana]|uniref:Uncharacterized protein n=1 Tax=Persea americana TaxID=3435 RepID=A0ACC2KK82_PERAE|nr:hypothetical protein MRB53_030103 [Persea americana]
MEEEKTRMKKGDTIVLYPSPGMGHLISMVELGKRILELNPPFSITILLTQASFNTGSTAPYVRMVESSFPAITFIHLPPISLPIDSSNLPHHETLIFRLLRLNNPLIHQSLLSLSLSSSILAILYDSFCGPVLDIAAQLHIPCYCFSTSPASCLAAFLYFPTLHRLTPTSFKDLHDTPLHFPGLPPVPASAIPLPMLDRNDEAYDGVLQLSGDLSKPAGILINTFDALEPRALKAISEGSCVPDAPTPPVYCIGPLIAKEKGEGSRDCLHWLGSQPSHSIVFLCFGSLGLFSSAQLIEIAVGLERSRQRFLWVVRSPPSEDPTKRFLPTPEPDLEALLPDGFLERTKGQGLVVKSWAPQMAVLSHNSVGGFVTHCGWNSVLEALCAGVPMVAWPLYAEQRLNRVVLVEEMGLAMPMVGAEKGWVEAEEVEKRVRGLMESEEGKALRERTAQMRDKAMTALGEGGSSRDALTELTRVWKQS